MFKIVHEIVDDEEAVLMVSTLFYSSLYLLAGMANLKTFGQIKFILLYRSVRV